MLKRFASYYKPHKVIFGLDMTASFLCSLIGIFYPFVIRKMLNDFIPNKEYALIIIFASVLVGMYLIKMGLNYFIQYQGHVMGVKIQAQMRRDMFAHLQKLPYSFFDDHETGKIMSRMTSDLFEISELAHHGPENLIISVFSILTSFVYLITINVSLTLIIFICAPFLVVVTYLLRKRMKTAFKKRREADAVINAAIQSSISGIGVTKAFTNSAKEEEKFEIGNKKFIEANKKAYKAMGQFHSSTTFITDVFNVVVLLAGGLFLYADKINFGDYSAFIVSTNLFIGPITTLIGFMEQFQSGATGFERFIEVMDTKPETDCEDAADILKAEGHIEFKNVTYGYGEGDNVLKNISLDIEKGKKYALVGPSGGGKTTICHLIPKFYNVEQGEILIDGTEIHKITMESLRRNIGIVQQDVYLFNASIKENILYGRLDASDDEVIEAAKCANIHDYVMSLPNGYDTVIGERGVKLSGGQKQRLSIARVFLKNPSVLILDEATSALDNTTEILIQDALDELCKGRTTIVVAHRLSTIKNADEIAVISDGQIIEKGTHRELMDINGEYSKLYNMQFKTISV